MTFLFLLGNFALATLDPSGYILQRGDFIPRREGRHDLGAFGLGIALVARASSPHEKFAVNPPRNVVYAVALKEVS
jgi:hypothetical protein